MRINPKFVDKFVKVSLNLQAFFTVGILVVIVLIIFFKGIKHFNLEFLLTFPEDMGRHGGIFPAIVGTILLVLLSLIFATPLGVSTAIFLTEYTK